MLPTQKQNSQGILLAQCTVHPVCNLSVKREKVFRKFLILGEIYCIQKKGRKHSLLKCLYTLQGKYAL